MELLMRPTRRLPTDPVPRALALVERSRPSTNRPRLTDPELEARMAAMEAERAMDYAEREDVIDRLDRVAETIDESADGVVRVELDDDDSVVHHLRNLRR